jgi:hypothetical protein
MKPEELTNPLVGKLVTAINTADRAGFLAVLTPEAALTDDGNPKDLLSWINREIFAVNGHMTVDREEEDGLRLLARYRNDTYGEMSTWWRFRLSGDRISRIDTGQA